MAFEPNEEVDVISGCKAADGIGSMLVHPADEIVRHPNVKGAMFSAGH